MKRLNLGRGFGKGSSERGAVGNLTPQARRLLIIGLVGIILVSVAWIATKFLFPTAPPPPPPPRAKVVPPPPPVAQPQAPAAPAPAPKPEEAKKVVAVAPKRPPAPSFSVQVGSMVQEENARALKRRLDQLGYPSLIRKGSAFITKHAVYVGEQASQEEAEELGRKLNVEGFPSQVVPLGERLSLQVGSFFNLDEAIDLAHELQKKNYRPKIVSKPVSAVVYQVRVGPFGSRGEARKKGEELKGKGFTFLVVKN